jgi:cobyrinic acid a,c-diamide synthase
MVTVPRVVIAAPASGQGKTTLATGLLAAFAASGLGVAGFKVGPDYIDPGYHGLASGRPGRNLDPVLVGEHRVAPLFAHGAAAAGLAVIEGVMGLHDGRTGAGEFGSTAHVARLLDAPVILVVDAAAQGRSIAALVHGFGTFRPGTWLAGVILNRVGSARHADLLRDALTELGVPVLGVLHRTDAIAMPSRHLGLVPVAERRPEAECGVAALAAHVASGVDLAAVLAVARSAPPLPAASWSPAASAPVPGDPVVAVAGGPAFSFGYAETAELLAGAGAQVRTVDPLRDETLPAGTRALVVGGGFPEVYAAELAANAPLRAAVAALVRRGAPVAAECAGLLWLCRSLDGAPMCAVLPAEARMTDRLTLGYRDAVAVGASWLADTGTRISGHEFHRTEVRPVGSGTVPAWSWPERPADGFVAGRVHASYLHLHWAGRPEIASRLVGAAAQVAAHDSAVGPCT